MADYTVSAAIDAFLKGGTTLPSNIVNSSLTTLGTIVGLNATSLAIDTSTLTSSVQQLVIKSANSLYVRGDSGSPNAIFFGTQAINAWILTNAGHLLGAVDNTFDLGAAGNQVRDIFVGRNGLVGGTFGITGATTITGLLTANGGITVVGGAKLITTNTALTAGATGNVPALTAGPVAGNPTKWIAISDNGTTRYIPTW